MSRTFWLVSQGGKRTVNPVSEVRDLPGALDVDLGKHPKPLVVANDSVWSHT